MLWLCSGGMVLPVLATVNGGFFTMATHIQIKCTDDAIAKGLRYAATACGMSLRQYTLYAAAKHTARLFADEPWGFDAPLADTLRSGDVTDDERAAYERAEMAQNEKLRRAQHEVDVLRGTAIALADYLESTGMTSAQVEAIATGASNDDDDNGVAAPF
jgi:hypothetical protein